MRDNPVNLIRRHAGALHRGICRSGELFNRVAEDLIPLHPQIAGGACADAAVDIQQIFVPAVRIQVGRQDTAVI